LIKRNTLGAISRKNTGPTSPRVPRKYDRRLHGWATEAHDCAAGPQHLALAG